MTTDCLQPGPEVGTSGDSLRSAGKSVVATVKHMRTHHEHRPRSMAWRSESASNRRGGVVESAKMAHDGRGRRIKWEIPV